MNVDFNRFKITLNCNGNCVNMFIIQQHIDASILYSIKSGRKKYVVLMHCDGNEEKIIAKIKLEHILEKGAYIYSKYNFNQDVYS